MSDNVTTQTTVSTVPTGTAIATDDIGGAHYQRVKVTWGSDGTANDTSAARPLPVVDSAAGETLADLLTEADFDTKTGALTETAPATDTASSGLNGRLQRVAQRITSLIAATLSVKVAYQTTKALTNASVSASSSGENTLISGTASQTIRVFKIALVAASAVNVSFKNAAGGTSLTGAIPLTANGAMVLESNDGEPLFVSATAGAFILNLSAAVAVTGFIQYVKS